MYEQCNIILRKDNNVMPYDIDIVLYPCCLSLYIHTPKYITKAEGLGPTGQGWGDPRQSEDRGLQQQEPSVDRR